MVCNWKLLLNFFNRIWSNLYRFSSRKTFICLTDNFELSPETWGMTFLSDHSFRGRNGEDDCLGGSAISLVKLKQTLENLSETLLLNIFEIQFCPKDFSNINHIFIQFNTPLKLTYNWMKICISYVYKRTYWFLSYYNLALFKLRILTTSNSSQIVNTTIYYY